MNDNISGAETKECHELIFKHFPAELTEQECFEFMKSLGAVSTRVLSLSSARQKYYVGEFPSVEHAWNIIRAVHQRPIVDKRVSVEFYRPYDSAHTVLSESDVGKIQLPAEPSKFVPMAPRWDPCLPVPVHLKYKYPAPTATILTNMVRCMMSCTSFYTQVLHLMNRLHLPPPFGDTDLFPGNLIVIAESDLPSKGVTPVEVVPQSIATKETQGSDGEEEAMDFSSSTESELDSEEDEQTAKPVRSRLPTSVRRPHTRLANKQLVQKGIRKRSNGTVDQSTKRSAMYPVDPHAREPRPVAHVSDLFDTIAPTAKLQLNVPEKLSVRKETTGESASRAVEGGFGVIRPQLNLDVRPGVVDSSETAIPSSDIRPLDAEFQLRKDTIPHRSSNIPSHRPSSSSDSEDVDQSGTIDSSVDSAATALSLNDLRLGRLTEEERQNYPVFARGYQPGEPTSRLYIKNLAPLTTEHDLYRVFGAFQSGPVTDLNSRPRIRFTDSERFSIRLLTEGRMKGQAFVSLQCELTALQALEATNGFLLHERPMVVQFARGAKAKVDEKSLIQTT